MQINPVDVPIFSWRSILILSSHLLLRLPNGLFTFSNQNYARIFLPSPSCHIPRPSRAPLSDHPRWTGEFKKSISSMCSVSPKYRNLLFADFIVLTLSRNKLGIFISSLSSFPSLLVLRVPSFSLLCFYFKYYVPITACVSWFGGIHLHQFTPCAVHPRSAPLL